MDPYFEALLEEAKHSRSSRHRNRLCAHYLTHKFVDIRKDYPKWMRKIIQPACRLCGERQWSELHQVRAKGTKKYGPTTKMPDWLKPEKAKDNAAR